MSSSYKHIVLNMYTHALHFYITHAGLVPVVHRENNYVLTCTHCKENTSNWYITCFLLLAVIYWYMVKILTPGSIVAQIVRVLWQHQSHAVTYYYFIFCLGLRNGTCSCKER